MTTENTPEKQPAQALAKSFDPRDIESREWVVIADEEIETGAEAIITAIEGNALRVKRQTSQ
jgi:hypothetical protein